jgi:hypothetical protein
MSQERCLSQGGTASAPAHPGGAAGDLGTHPSSGQTLERFHDAWRHGQRPDIDDYLDGGWPQRRRVLPLLVAADLEWRLRAGETARVEGYLIHYPELVGDAPVLVDLIVTEYRSRRGREPQLARAEYLQRFPQWGEELIRLLPAADAAPEQPAGTPERRTSATALLAILFAAVVGVGVALVLLDGARRRAVEERVEAEQGRRRAIAEAVRVLRGLLEAEASGPARRQQEARVLHALGNLHRELGELGEAQCCYHQALERCRQLVAEFPGEAAYRRDLEASHAAVGRVGGGGGGVMRGVTRRTGD